MSQICFFFLLLISSSFSVLNAEQRSVSVQINPLCGDLCKQPVNGSYLNLVWIKLDGKQDTIHYLYSTMRTFSFMVFRTNTSASLFVDWKAFISNTNNQVDKVIFFNPAPLEYAAYLIPQIYEYNDVNGVANMSLIPNNQSYWRTFSTSDLKWSLFKTVSNVSGLFEATKADNQTSGSFKFLIKYPGLDKERDTDLPHLLLNSASNSIDFIIDSIRPSFNYSKFAVNILLVDFKHMNARLATKRTLDDEFTPGKFGQTCF